MAPRDFVMVFQLKVGVRYTQLESGEEFKSTLTVIIYATDPEFANAVRPEFMFVTDTYVKVTHNNQLTTELAVESIFVFRGRQRVAA